MIRQLSVPITRITLNPNDAKFVRIHSILSQNISRTLRIRQTIRQFIKRRLSTKIIKEVVTTEIMTNTITYTND